MNDWTPFGHNDPLVSDQERAHVLVSAVEYRPGMWEARCKCGITYFGLPSRDACKGWLTTHREIEKSIAAMAPRGAQ